MKYVVIYKGFVQMMCCVKKINFEPIKGGKCLDF
jgi:hypothetical protein